MRVAMRYAGGSDWTRGRVRADDYRLAAVRFYNRRMRAPFEPKVTHVALCEQIGDGGAYVVQLGVWDRLSNATRLTPRIVVRVEG